MFLAIKEIKHEKMRYGLIVFMIFLISYMILAIWGLAYGLARENTVALENWQAKSVVLNKNAMPTIAASGVISKRSRSVKGKNYKSYGIKQFIQKLPGYSAQNLTFELMIAFMFIISLMIVGVFLYILTIKKLPNYAALRAQGVPAKTLVWATISQSLLLTVAGLAIALLAIWGTAAAMPSSAPMAFTGQIFASAIGGMLAIALIGGLIPVKTILKIDPVAAIGG